MPKKKVIQAEVNIGTAGHVDHGKTTIVKALTGQWVDRHSEEIKRGITIRLGYADADFYKCGEQYTVNPADCKKPEFLRKVSFVDSPGHEALMTVMISGSSLVDGAILVIAANEPCPQPQTQEHLAALEINGVKNIVIVQNKIDLVSPEKAKEHHNQIIEFVKGTNAEGAPIIPMAANHCVNLDKLIEAIEEKIPTPKRDTKKPLRMVVARSFDVNKPGEKIKNLKGGVLGGSILQGKIREGDEIEIAPGLEIKGKYETIITTARSVSVTDGVIKEAGPGGLVAVQTGIDPALAKGDRMSGNIISKPGETPPVRDRIGLEHTLLERAVSGKPENLKQGEMLVLNALTMTTIGQVTKAGPEYCELTLRRPLCISEGDRVTISRKVRGRWSLIGYGIVK